ncbi:hypothetical protein RGQ29_008104 [Quercus rubra]|uniref:Glutaredoxin domain-containing protein n=1 Tax=Quercus rubra TaxID=3512 RepID=A0AAN7I874_QUERU|nr:hypothetical protein RGQ29_008104 [Quercus rubra]
MAAVTSLVAENPVVIFSRNNNCPMTHTVNSLITGFGANPVLYYLDRMPNRQQIESALAQLGRQQNQPAVFIGQQFIGGPTEREIETQREATGKRRELQKKSA